MPENDRFAELLAARFYELLRERGRAVGVTRFFTFHEWRETPGEVRAVLTEVFEQLMTDAREQREEWTRAALESEVRRMREDLQTPGRLLRIEEGVVRASLSVAAEIEEKERRGDWHPRPKPPLGALRWLDAEPGRLHLLECSNQLCHWRSSTLHSEPGDACTNPRGCSGVFVLASPEGRIDDSKSKLGARLLQLRDSLQGFAGVERAQASGDPPITAAIHTTTAERLNLLAVELESIVYEAGLAPRPPAQEGADPQ